MNYNTAFGNYVKILNAVFLCKKILFQLSLYVLGQKRARKWKKPRCGCKKRKSKQENPSRKFIAQSQSGNWAWEQRSKLENPRCGCRRTKASKKTKKENKQKLTPEIYEKFPG